MTPDELTGLPTMTAATATLVPAARVTVTAAAMITDLLGSLIVDLPFMPVVMMTLVRPLRHPPAPRAGGG